MKFAELSSAQSEAIVRSLYAVASAGGTVAPEPFEVACIEAAQHHLLHLDPPLPGSPGPLPADLEAVLDSAALRKSTVRLLATISIADQQVSAEKVAVVEETARRFGISEFGLLVLRRVARGQYRRNGLGLMRRFVNHYWSYEGRAELRDWAAMIWTIAPWIPGLRRYLRLHEVQARYRALGQLPADTLGYAVHDYYERNGFPVPGEPKSIPEGWARHEVYHVLANYNTNLQGELLLAGFIGGNTDEMCLDLMLPALVQLHAGKTFVPGPAAEGLLQPDLFFRAVARGAAMQVDLLNGWRLWPTAGQPLREVQTRYGIPPFTREELSPLIVADALLVSPPA